MRALYHDADFSNIGFLPEVLFPRVGGHIFQLFQDQNRPPNVALTTNENSARSAPI